MEPAALIGLDWGTSSLRAYRIGPQGAVLERREQPRGILHVQDGAFAAVLADIAGDWLAAEPVLPLLACGMIGSRQGWVEAPYAPCPAGGPELVRGLAEVDGPGGCRVRIVPGLSCRDPAGTPDVMRGEETQVLGELSARGAGSGRFVLPGTHSKWVSVEDGRIRAFATAMTGELFDVLRQHSILGRLMRDGGHDEGAFRRGLERAASPDRQGGGKLLHDLFGVRTLGLLGDLPETALASYLSGLLIGAEIVAQAGVAPAPTPTEPPLIVIGSGRLTGLYLSALKELGLRAEPGHPDCVAAGLFAIARAAGLRSTDHA